MFKLNLIELTGLVAAVACWGSIGLYFAHAQGYLTPAVPQPYTSVPLGPTGTGVVGTALTYVTGDAQQRQGVQRTVATTDASGNIAVTWNWAFISSTPTVVIEAGNPAGANAIVCNWRTRNATGMTGFCQQTSVALIALLGISITVAPVIPSAGTPVSVIMAEPTQ